MDEITIFQKDYGFDLDFRCQDYSGDVKNISGYTVIFNTWTPGTPSTIVASGSCTLTSALGGHCTYTVGQNDFLSSDRYYASLEANMSGVRESFGSFTIKVAEKP